MQSKFKLLPEQVENLNTQIRLNNERLGNLATVERQQFSEMKNERFDSTTAVSLDSSLLSGLHVARKNIQQAKEQLLDYEIIEPSASDIIGLGSTFEIVMDYGDGFEDTEILTLVQVRNAGDSSDYVSINSPLGRAVNGATVGKQIRYLVEDRVITGSISKIVKPKIKTL